MYILLCLSRSFRFHHYINFTQRQTRLVKTNIYKEVLRFNRTQRINRIGFYNGYINRAITNTYVATRTAYIKNRQRSWNIWTNTVEQQYPINYAKQNKKRACCTFTTMKEHCVVNERRKCSFLERWCAGNVNLRQTTTRESYVTNKQYLFILP